LAPNEAEWRRWNDEGWTAAWPRRERLTQQVTPFLLDGVALRPGERVVDVGCGGGRSSLAAAELVGATGAVVGADVSKPLLALAQRRAAEAGVANVSFVQADMQVDDLGARGFDVAISQFGVMFFDDPEAAFANIGSHVRPGGRTGFVCWQAVERNPWFAGTALARFVPAASQPPPGRGPSGAFSLGDPDHVGRLLLGAGFADVARTAHDLVVDAPRETVVDDAQLRMLGVPDDALDDARQVAEAHLRRFRQADGRYLFPIAFQVFTARRC
jgi:SAM-dependent methyltransferase